ncbi:MAG: hypothetical protein ACOCZ3_02895 [Bacillota bacterium]
MVLELSTAFSIRCPDCGRLQVDQINIFELSGRGTRDIYCSCGNKKASISRQGSDHIRVDYYCIICDQKHTTYIPASHFWNHSQLHPLLCQNTSLNLGYYGSYSLLQEELQRQQRELDSLASELGFDDFVDPELMLEVLDHLHDKAAESGLYCECGSHDINIELFSDRVELSCNNCQATLTIPASYQQDLQELKMSDELILTLKRPSRVTGRSWVKNKYKEE